MSAQPAAFNLVARRLRGERARRRRGRRGARAAARALRARADDRPARGHGLARGRCRRAPGALLAAPARAPDAGGRAGAAGLRTRRRRRRRRRRPPTARRGRQRACAARRAKPLQRYRCAACGFEAQHYFWQCPGCLELGQLSAATTGGPLMNAAPSTRERLAAARVLVVGDAMLDRYWFGAVERISPEAPVPVVRVNPRRKERLGGAANVALERQDARRAGDACSPSSATTSRRAASSRCSSKSGIETLFGATRSSTPSSSCASSAARSSCSASTSRSEPDHEVLARHAGRLRDARCRSTTRCCSPTTARAA